MPNAWGVSWGGDTGAWGLSWGSGEAPPPVEVGVPPRIPGGHPFLRLPKRLKRTKDEEIEQIIQAVAAEQVARLERDEHKRFEELERELQLRGVTWEARYLEALNLRRELLIDQEIERLLKQKLDDDNRLILILMALI